jgi:hypothetical protein
MTSIVGIPGEWASMPGFIRSYPVAWSPLCRAVMSLTGTHTVEPVDERDHIRAAMQRILHGAPQRSNGALTVVALAIESRCSEKRSS